MQSVDKRDTDPISQFSLSIFRLNGILARNGDAITSSVGQSSARWQVLGRVHYRPQTVAQIARDQGHARQSVQRVADVLVGEGLAMYKPHRSDKRTRLLALTPEGEKVLDSIYSQYGEWSQHIVTKLDAEQLAKLANTLNEIAEALEADNYHSNKV